MMARMKSVPVRVISIVAVCAALVGACESDYDELAEDLLEPGWGEDAGKLPACTPTMDASTGGGTDAGQDTGTTSDAGADTGTNGDSGSNGADAGEADTGTPDAGAPDAT